MSTNSRVTTDKKAKPKPGQPASGKPPAKGGAAAAPSKPNAAPPRSSKPKPRATGPQRPLPVPGLSLDRKLDIVGILLVFLGLGIGLSLITAQPSGLLLLFVNLVTQAAGWGRPGIPLAVMGVGVWLVLRKFGDKLPRLEPERLLGLLLLYLALLTTLHFWAAEDVTLIYDMVAAGQGGGLLGAALLSLLLGSLGTVGAGVLLVAWWIIAIVFTAGLSVPELITLLAGFFRRAAPLARQLPLPTGSPARQRDPNPPPAAAPARPASTKAPTPGIAPVGAQPISNLKSPISHRPPDPQGGAPLLPGSPASLSPADLPLLIGAIPEPVWELPTVEAMLEAGTEGGADDDLDRTRANLIEGTLASFGAPVKVVEVNRGPTITQFGVEPGFIEARSGTRTKVKVGKIAALADDLALALSAHSIRIEAPVPGKGFVGIEVPNAETSVVALRDVMESDNFGRLKGGLRLGLGQDVSGSAIAASLDRMPHLLIAGTTGSGKSVCVNAIIACLLLQNTPDELKFVMVDPKRVELTSYNGIPHLLAPVVVELERVVAALQWVTREMDERYRKFSKGGVRNIEDYNRRQAGAGDKKLPYLVIIIDELADLMMLAPDETERTVTRLAQLARATGIHLIIATQRPSVDVVTGLIKANFPARIAFAVASGVDSRVILDQPGAERLLGRGDMLFMSPDAAAPLRMQGVFVSDSEIHNIVQYWKDLRGEVMPDVPVTDASSQLDQPELASPATNHQSPISPLQTPLWDSGPFAAPEAAGEDDDELLQEAIAAVRDMKKASISLLQRRLRIGYTRSARLIDVLEEKGIIGPAESGAKPREVINYGGQPPPAESAPDEGEGEE